jgi:hypothetical protein
LSSNIEKGPPFSMFEPDFVGRYLKNIFKKCQAPANQDYSHQTYLLQPTYFLNC